jgi:hypothetical protein
VSGRFGEFCDPFKLFLLSFVNGFAVDFVVERELIDVVVDEAVLIFGCERDMGQGNKIRKPGGRAEENEVAVDSIGKVAQFASLKIFPVGAGRIEDRRQQRLKR